MSNEKFTKGPWQHTPCGPSDSNGMGICAMWGLGEEMDANSYLISTAPEMYELLGKFKDFAISEGWEHVLINEAEELLAKARGEK